MELDITTTAFTTDITTTGVTDLYDGASGYPEVTFDNPFDGCGMYLHGTIYAKFPAELFMGAFDQWEYYAVMRAQATVSGDTLKSGGAAELKIVVNDIRDTTAGSFPIQALVPQVVFPFTLLEGPGGSVTFRAYDWIDVIDLEPSTSPLPSAEGASFHVSFTAWPIADPGVVPGPPPPA